MSYCVRLKPDQQNVLMAGTHDKKILQWDMDSGDLVQVSVVGHWASRLAGWLRLPFWGGAGNARRGCCVGRSAKLLHSVSC